MLDRALSRRGQRPSAAGGQGRRRAVPAPSAPLARVSSRRSPDLGIDCERLEAELLELAEIGRVGESGVSRLAFTELDLCARDLVRGWLEGEGMSTRLDALGNLIARLPGHRQHLPAVAAGSHIDTPPLGGRYDGTVGVLGALAAVRALGNAGLRTEAPIEIIVFACEEPGRFGVSCLGSKAMAGKFDASLLDRLSDRQEMMLRQALEEAGLDPDGAPGARRETDELAAYLELHVEQGRVLEDAGLGLGVVTSIAGPTRMRVRLGGLADHSGATPMSLRRDALSGSAEAILALEALARADDGGTVATVGAIEVEPGVLNIVPGAASFSVDIRGNQDPAKRRVIQAFYAALERIAGKRHLEVSWDVSVDEPAVPLGEEIVSGLVSLCRDLELPHKVMPSGAGHDAQHMAAITRSGMIFVPSRAGISHSPEEFTELDQICTGALVLAHALVRKAGIFP